MLQITNINWISNSADEAEILITDGNFSIFCFSQPFNGSYNSDIPQPLNVLNANEIYKIEGMQSFSVQREGNTFGYKLKGKVIENMKNHVKIGKFILELDVSLPSDVEIGDYISFGCDRIDIY
ncbi:MAG: hypothetical protein AAF489_08760 [Bacteroidota bacterium]